MWLHQVGERVGRELIRGELETEAVVVVITNVVNLGTPNHLGTPSFSERKRTIGLRFMKFERWAGLGYRSRRNQDWNITLPHPSSAMYLMTRIEAHVCPPSPKSLEFGSVFWSTYKVNKKIWTTSKWVCFSMMRIHESASHPDGPVF